MSAVRVHQSVAENDAPSATTDRGRVRGPVRASNRAVSQLRYAAKHSVQRSAARYAVPLPRVVWGVDLPTPDRCSRRSRGLANPKAVRVANRGMLFACYG